MGGTYKKKLRAEKSKVKLKGAKLPKGLNVTKTEFKVRKITIREQLKESQYDVEGQRKVNIKELLTRLKHHSANFRLEALRNVREAILAGHPGIKEYLGELIQGLSAICLDIEKNTRRESFKVLSALMSNLTVDNVAPFFHAISSYLRCAMTHIQPTIQEDSLLMLDVLLQYVPSLIAEHSAKVFQNFLEMISRVRNDGGTANRALIVNMGNKQTTVKWRSKVLQRLQQMLLILAEHSRDDSGKRATTADKSKSITRTVKFNVKEPQYLPLNRTYAAQGSDISELFCRTLGITTDLNVNGFTVEETRLRSYVEHLLPLLKDTWLEVRPKDGADNAQILLTNDAAETLRVVCEIMENLWILVDIHSLKVNNNVFNSWFQRKHGEAFVNSFLQYAFPYQQNDDGEAEPPKKKPRKAATKKTATQQFCLQQNISLSYLLCRFCINSGKKQSSKFLTTLQYLNTIVSNPQLYTLEHGNHLISTLRTYLLDNGVELLALHATETRLLLRTTLKAFLSNEFPARDGVSAKMLILLCDIVQKSQLFTLYGNEEFTNFLAYLPQLLLKPTISEKALLSMSCLGKQQNVIFLKSLIAFVEPIIENLAKIQVTGAQNAFEGKKHIMNLFYWINIDWTAQQQEILLSKVQNSITDKRIICYYKYVLTRAL